MFTSTDLINGCIVSHLPQGMPYVFISAGRRYKNVKINDRRTNININENQLKIQYFANRKKGHIKSYEVHNLDRSYTPFINAVIEDPYAIEMFLEYWQKSKRKWSYFTLTQLIFLNYTDEVTVCISLPETLMFECVVKNSLTRDIHSYTEKTELMFIGEELEIHTLDQTFDPFIEATRNDPDAIGILLDYWNMK